MGRENNQFGSRGDMRKAVQEKKTNRFAVFLYEFCFFVYNEEDGIVWKYGYFRTASIE